VSKIRYNNSNLKRASRRTDMMDRIMKQAGVNVISAARVERGATRQEVLTKCVACHSARECRDWLALSEAGDILAQAEFCDNFKHSSRLV
jgi:Family of unknown function (DUF6455)